MLVGRDAEQQQIAALLAGARVGQSGVLVVTGEAGIGKTALVDHARGLTGAMAVLTVVGTEAEQDLPFAGLAQLLRVSAGELDRLPAPQAQALAVALALQPGTGVDRFAVGAALLTLLTQRSEDRPVCILIDDAQLVDRPSQEAMVFVARRLLADAIAVLVTARTEEPCLFLVKDLPQLRLGGLAAGATRELAREGLGEAAGVELVDRVVTLSGGNPLAVHELVQERERLRALPPGAPGPVPRVLVELYAERAARLSRASQAVLQVAAAVGDDLGVVSRTCTVLGVTATAITEAEAAGLVSVRGDRVQFSHPLVRSALYATASPAERRRVHAAIASVLNDDDSDRRAWHRSEATVGADPAAAAEMEAVADRAAGRGAYSIAATAAERAAGLSAQEDERAARLLAAGTWSWYAGEAERATALLLRANLIERSPALSSRGTRLRGVIAARNGGVDEARDLLLRAGDESPDPSEAIACYAETIDACFYLADAATAVLAAERAEALLSAATPAAEVLGLLAVGMAKVLAGGDGIEQITEAVRRAEAPAVVAAVRQHDGVDHSFPVDLTWLVLGPMFLRDSSSGRALVQAAVDDQRGRSAIGALPHLLFHIARDKATTDDWPGAEADYSEAVGLAREFGQSTELAMSLAGLGWLEARQGRAEVATAHVTEALRLAEQYSVRIAGIWAGWASADLALGGGDVDAAVQGYRGVDELLVRLGVLDVDLSPAPEQVEALLRLGRTAEAAALSTAYAGRAAAKGRPWAQARAARTQGLLASDRDLDATFGRALQLHAATLDAYEQARTELAYGARLRRARRRIDARPLLRAALATFSRLGARAWAETAADEVEATGCDRGSARGSAGQPAHAARAPDRHAARRRPDHPSGGERAVPQSEDGRVPPAPRVHEVRHRLPVAARGPDASLTDDSSRGVRVSDDARSPGAPPAGPPR